MAEEEAPVEATGSAEATPAVATVEAPAEATPDVVTKVLRFTMKGVWWDKIVTERTKQYEYRASDTKMIINGMKQGVFALKLSLIHI